MEGKIKKELTNLQLRRWHFKEGLERGEEGSCQWLASLLLSPLVIEAADKRLFLVRKAQFTTELPGLSQQGDVGGGFLMCEEREMKNEKNEKD